MPIVNHKCELAYKGVYIQTYALILINVAIFISLKYFLEEYVLPYVVASYSGAKYQRLAASPDDDLEGLVRPVGNASKTLNILTGRGGGGTVAQQSSSNVRIKYTGKILFVFFQFIVAIICLGVGLYYLDPADTMWDKYQNFYGFILNSGLLTSFISCNIFRIELNKKKLSEKGTELDKLARYTTLMLGILSITLIPPVLTHLVPGSLIYGWVIVAFIFAICVILIAMVCLLEVFANIIRFICRVELPPASDKMFQLGLELAWRLLAIIFFQTFFNYMFAFYQVHSATMTGDDYIGVIRHDYELRTQTQCSFDHATDTIRHALVFFNWL